MQSKSPALLLWRCVREIANQRDACVSGPGRWPQRDCPESMVRDVDGRSPGRYVAIWNVPSGTLIMTSSEGNGGTL